MLCSLNYSLTCLLKSEFVGHFQCTFGVCFDIDGVLLRGSTPLPQATEAINLLRSQDGHWKVPVVFVTNALNRDIDKAAQLTQLFDVGVGTPFQSVPLATSLKPLSSKIPFRLVTVPSHFNVN